jgi:hypothetical protein
MSASAGGFAPAVFPPACGCDVSFMARSIAPNAGRGLAFQHNLRKDEAMPQAALFVPKCL